MISTDPIIFQVPVCAHVYKYMRIRLQGEPLLATFDNAPIGTWLWAMAQSEKVHMYLTHKGRTKRYRKYNLDDTSHLLTVGISEFHRSRNQMLLNVAEVQVFNRVVTKFMHDDLLTQIDQRPAGQDLQPTIRALADKYDFSDDDLSEDSLARLYYRVRAGSTHHSFREPQWSAVLLTTLVPLADQLAA